MKACLSEWKYQSPEVKCVPFRKFKGTISSPYFPRFELFLFITLASIVVYAMSIAYIQLNHGEKLVSENLRPSSIILSSNDKVMFTIDLLSNNGNVNPFLWGINAADKHLLWASNKTLEQRLSNAKIRIVRVGAIQYANYSLGHNMCTSPTSCNFSAMDAPLKTIFNAGAEPLFVVVAYPGGFAHDDWQSYASFMKQVVRRYNVNLVLGKKIRNYSGLLETCQSPQRPVE